MPDGFWPTTTSQNSSNDVVPLAGDRRLGTPPRPRVLATSLTTPTGASIRSRVSCAVSAGNRRDQRLSGTPPRTIVDCQGAPAPSSFELRSQRAQSRLLPLQRSSMQPSGEWGRRWPIQPCWRSEERQLRRRSLGDDAPAKSAGRAPEPGGGNPTPEPRHTTGHPSADPSVGGPRRAESAKCNPTHPARSAPS
jgi:hypothetical protein